MGDLWSGLFGAIIGGLLTSVAAWWQSHRQHIARVRAFKFAIASEMASLAFLARENEYSQILLAYADQIEAGGSAPEEFSIPILSNYFSIYETNAGLIGELDPDMSAEIVGVYQAAKSWADTFHPSTAHEWKRLPPQDCAAHMRHMAGRLETLSTECLRIANELSNGSVVKRLEEAFRAHMTPRAS